MNLVDRIPVNQQILKIGTQMLMRARDQNFLRTFVSHSLQGAWGVISTTLTLSSVNAELPEAL